mgnify:CR=1 FL=1
MDATPPVLIFEIIPMVPTVPTVPTVFTGCTGLHGFARVCTGCTGCTGPTDVCEHTRDHTRYARSRLHWSRESSVVSTLECRLEGPRSHLLTINTSSKMSSTPPVSIMIFYCQDSTDSTGCTGCTGCTGLHGFARVSTG